MTDRMVLVTIVETVNYYRTVSVDDLMKAAGYTEWDDTTIEEEGFGQLLDLARDRASSGDTYAMAFAEDLERHGDVQGQEWSADWADD
jgi:hypothetical protein